MTRTLLLFLLLNSIVLFAPSLASADMTEYRLTFEGRWTSDLARPGSAHFSPFIGSLHQAGGSFMAVGQTASSGVENVAELGSNGVLRSEINAGVSAGTVGQLLERGGNIGPEQLFSMDINVDSEFALLSVITMIAPSPDWFVGVHDLNLLDMNGDWRQHISIDLNSYDAGTENGSGFSLNNSPTVPQGVITMLDAAVPTNPLFGEGSIARLTLTRAVPEPNSLFGIALASLVVGIRRKRSA